MIGDFLRCVEPSCAGRQRPVGRERVGGLPEQGCVIAAFLEVFGARGDCLPETVRPAEAGREILVVMRQKETCQPLPRSGARRYEPGFVSKGLDASRVVERAGSNGVPGQLRPRGRSVELAIEMAPRETRVGDKIRPAEFAGYRDSALHEIVAVRLENEIVALEGAKRRKIILGIVRVESLKCTVRDYRPMPARLPPNLNTAALFASDRSVG